jgi:hypothetical protein
MTDTPTAALALMQAAELVATHLAEHELPEPASLQVMTRAGRSEASAQVHSLTVARVAADPLAWADTLATVTIQVWRPSHGDMVHLSIASTLASPAVTVDLDVYGGADDGPALFADLAPGEHCTVSLGRLRTWAASTTGTPGGGAAA